MDSSGPGNVATPATDIIRFEHFDELADAPRDHRYFNRKSHNANATIDKEKEILKENLPESIYVQVYKPRIDLMRAVIIGSHMTPYHDGLFFFDIYLPPDYPSNPPQVYYHSHGYRLNPNLYDHGFVSMSLINTCPGDSSQRWRKGESTIFQLLVSIQGLVLVEKPFFIDPKYEPYMNSNIHVKKSMAYNEDAFFFSCKVMLHITRKPPIGFSRFVLEHFKERSVSILAAIKAYENGDVLVGQFQKNDSSVSSYLQISAGFKSRLKKVGQDLEKAFAKQRMQEKRKFGFGKCLLLTLAGIIVISLFKRH